MSTPEQKIQLSIEQVNGISLHLAGAPADADHTDAWTIAKYLAPQTHDLARDLADQTVTVPEAITRLLNIVGALEARATADRLMPKGEPLDLPDEVMERLHLRDGIIAPS